MLTKLKINNSITFVILLFFLFSCSKKEEENYIAKVGDSYLTESMVENALNTSKDVHKFREEFIRDWMRRELLFLDAKKKGILESEEYKKLINNAKVEIANALLTKRIIESNPIAVTDKELEDFYINNIDEFKLTLQSFVFNQAVFVNRNDAFQFRKTVIRNGWKYSVNYFTENKSLISYKENKYEYIYNILPDNLRNEILQLDESEISRIIKTSENTFVIVQLIKKYNKNDVPEFEEIKDEIEKKYRSVKRKDIYQQYLKKLYSEYRFEIER